MSVSVVVWGTGNIGRTAIRTVLTHRDLELVDVIVHNPDKVDRDAGDLADVAAAGVAATDDIGAVLDRSPHAVVYAATGDTRPDEALTDILRCLRAGANVVTPAIFGLLHPATANDRLKAKVNAACEDGGTSFYVSGIDPGWAQDILPLLMSGVSGHIDEIRMLELFDYATYDAPEIVREVIGFGKPMDYLAPMLIPTVPTMIWGPMLHTLADGLGVELDDIVESIERLELTGPVDTVQGRFEAGTQGARSAALLSPQGKVLFDFLIVGSDGADGASGASGFALDCHRVTADDLAGRLKFYRLRARVDIAVTQARVLWSPDAALAGGFADPRHPSLGHRALAAQPAARAGSVTTAASIAATNAFHQRRIAAGVAEGVHDYRSGSVFPHEANLDLLGGVSLSKGCYIGQEVVSRMQHRSTARRRPLIVSDIGTGSEKLVLADAREVGKIGQVINGRAVGFLRLDRIGALKKASIGARPVKLATPEWASYGFCDSGQKQTET